MVCVGARGKDSLVAAVKQILGAEKSPFGLRYDLGMFGVHGYFAEEWES
jgi:hypothetical protein